MPDDILISDNLCFLAPEETEGETAPGEFSVGLHNLFLSALK